MLQKGKCFYGAAIAAMSVFFLFQAAAGNTTTQVGSIEVPYANRPDFDVAADTVNGVIHFVYRDNLTLYYVNSSNGGTSWTQPQTISADSARSPKIKVDTDGVVHLVHGSHTAGWYGWETRNWYRSRSVTGVWSTPIEVPRPSFSYGLYGPRIAVDGNKNVHIITWAYPRSTVGKHEDYGRILYVRKLHGQNGFETPMEFMHAKDGNDSLEHRESLGGGGAQDIVSDPHGNVHIIYRSRVGTLGVGGYWRFTYFSRNKNGNWSDWVRIYTDSGSPRYNTPVGAMDLSLSAFVDGSGALYFTGVFGIGEAWGAAFWRVYKTTADGTGITRLFSEEETGENGGGELIVLPNGDVWSTFLVLHANSVLTPNGRAVYRRYSTAAGTSTPYESISPSGYRNVTRNHAQTPKFTYLGGVVRLFYAEARDGGATPFKFYQRTFDSNSIFSGIRVTPSRTSVWPSEKKMFSATALDQGGMPMPSQPSFTWSVTGQGSIAASGEYTAPGSMGGPYTITATAAINGVQHTATATVTVESLVARINAGGGTVDGWDSQESYVNSPSRNFSISSSISVNGVTNAGPAELYQSCRHYSSDGTTGPIFTFPPSKIPDGDYTVRLHFAEPYYTSVADAAANRAMTVLINATAVLTDFSPATAAGATQKACVWEGPVAVNTGNGMTISLTKESGNDAFIQGIEIFAEGAASVFRVSASNAGVRQTTGVYCDNHGRISIVVSSPGDHRYQVFSLKGAHIVSGQGTGAATYSVDAARFPAGVYVAQIMMRGESVGRTFTTAGN